jgi:hypothetical protein
VGDNYPPQYTACWLYQGAETGSTARG